MVDNTQDPFDYGSNGAPLRKGLMTLQRDFDNLASAFVKLAEQVRTLTSNMQILATEIGIIKKQLEVENGNSGNEREAEGSGEEKK